MLELYAQRAQITDESVLRVMDLGCGWGSVTLWFAQRFPKCTFVGLSNSKTQREYILSTAKARGLKNVDVITGDIALLTLPETVQPFDRVISIEMMEHMKNYQKLLHKVSTFLKPNGLLFVHIFVARRVPWHFVDNNEPSDWMAKYFFTGGTMPADDTLPYFQDDLALQQRWRVNGKHYSLTLEAWLQRMDAQETKVRAVLARSYGKDNEELWWNRWRAFFFICSELFNYNDGNEWYVGHYLFQKR
jgi:cyclopropane-fatty-acyl-phospholipid synthase